MKRVCLLVLAFIFILRAQNIKDPFLIKAQEFDANRAFNDYLYNLNLYQNSHLEYVSSRNEYQNYQTLTSQNNALEKTRTMLENRSEAQKSYLTALRMRLREETSILSYRQNLYYIKLDEEIGFLTSNKNDYSSAATLEDLVKTSDQFADRYPEQNLLSFQTLGEIASGKETGLKNRLNSLLEKTEKKIGLIKEAGDNTNTEERWLIQAREKIKRAEEKDREAYNILAGMKANESNKIDVWNKAQKAFEEENLYLKESLSYLKEIIREIKSAD